MDRREQIEHIDHALNPLWKLHYELNRENKTERRVDDRLDTIIRKLYEVRDLLIYE